MALLRSVLAAVAMTLLPLSHAWNIELPPCTEPFKPFVYSGCFQEGKDSNALIFRSSLDTANMTVEMCMAECKGNGFRYAGLEYYGVCFCGATVDGAQIDESKCSFPCSGDKTQKCGGDKTLSVWQDPTFPNAEGITVDSYKSLGCYTDESSKGRTLSYPMDLGAVICTPKSCLAACEKQGFPFAGIEYGNQCFCGVVLANDTVKVDSSQCDFSCLDDSSTKCGGRSRLSLWIAKDLWSLEPCGQPPGMMTTTTLSMITTTTKPTEPATTTSSIDTTTGTPAGTTTTPAGITTSPLTTSTTETLDTTLFCDETTTTSPVGTMTQLTGTTTESVGTSTMPLVDTTTKPADTTTSDCDTTFVSSQPVTTSLPADTTTQPMGTTTESVVTSTMPLVDTTSKSADTITSDCDTTSMSSQPMTTTSLPADTTTQPMGTSTESVVTSTMPLADTTSKPAEITTSDCDTTFITSQPITTTQPADTTTVPDITTSQPTDTTTVPADTTTVPADTTTVPDITTSQPTDTTTLPADTTTVPDITTSEPAITTSQPADTTTLPAITTTKKPTTTTKQIPDTTTSLCTTTVTLPAKCEWQCGNWCGPALPSWEDSNGCHIAKKTCLKQISSCFKTAGWPKSVECFKFKAWCNYLDSHCEESCPGKACNKWDCWNKYHNGAGSPPARPPITSTSVYPCATTAKPAPTTTEPVIACPPKHTNLCTQPTNDKYGYGPDKPVGGIPLPVVGCNDRKEEFNYKPYKYYTEAESRNCPGFPWYQWPSVCSSACKEQYDHCVTTYSKGCETLGWKSQFHKRAEESGADVSKRNLFWGSSGGSDSKVCAVANFGLIGSWLGFGSDSMQCWGFGGNKPDWALARCKAQYKDCMDVNKRVKPAQTCNEWRGC
ncbi:hypothetical protein E4U55_003993 [Claviceps digitariae]|nr:hypothetical protein E4U55_003993 [Claviceps digitariae]